MAHNPCVHVYYGIRFAGGPLLYLIDGVHVDKFIYLLSSDEVERIFEVTLSLKLQINWTGEASWFLGKSYKWNTLMMWLSLCHNHANSKD
jgi:hypothetical protein